MDEELDSTEPETKSGISTGQWVMLGTLAVLGVAAAVLTYAVRQQQRRDGEGTLAGMLDTDAPWAVSLKHLAGATDIRLAGIEERLDQLTVKMGGTLPPPPAPVDKNFPPPVPSAPESVSMSGVPVGAEEPPPPGPAATSQ